LNPEVSLEAVTIALQGRILMQINAAGCGNAQLRREVFP
jgi:hypothetical protein